MCFHMTISAFDLADTKLKKLRIKLNVDTVKHIIIKRSKLAIVEQIMLWAVKEINKALKYIHWNKWKWICVKQIK